MGPTEPVYPLPPVESATGRTLCSGTEGIDFWHLCYVEAMKALLIQGVEKLKAKHGEHISDTLARQAAAVADAMQRHSR